MKIKYKKNKNGDAVTPCPHGFTTFVTNRLKIAGHDCIGCKYRVHVDFDECVVECSRELKKKPQKPKKNAKNVSRVRKPAR